MPKAKVPQTYFKTDPWAVVEEGFDPARGRIAESVFSLANEYMGVRGYFDEGYSGDRLVGFYVNGMYEVMPIQHPQVFKGLRTRRAFNINALDWLYTRIALDGETLDLAASKFSDFSRRLDMRTGTLTRRFTWHTAGGKRLRLTFERFLSLVHSPLACQRITFEPLDFSGQVEFASGLDFSPPYELAGGWSQVRKAGERADGKNFWTCPRAEQIDGVQAILGRTETTGQWLLSAFRLAGDPPAEPVLVEDDKFIGVSGMIDLRKGEAASVDKIAVNVWERDATASAGAAWDSALSKAAGLLGMGFDDAHDEHAAAWARTWETLDIEIDGDADLQQGLRFSLFNLHQTYHGNDARVNIPCKGLTAEVYYGWMFWDTETYCLPFYLFTAPKAARALLEYRHIYLPQALERARELDCHGARYPFATIDGTECCGTWQHCDLEIHVDAAVSYAIWLYMHTCDDKPFLHEMGMEMLLQICRFFASRGEWSPRGDFGLYGVMGPDEFHTMVHNNCYTNYMARKTFRWTLEAMERMAEEAPEELAAVRKKVGLRDEEPAAWRRMAEEMRIPYDEKRHLFEQHDGYFDLPEVDVRNLPPEQIPIYANWVYEKIFRYNMIKQPDVLLLPLFFGDDFTAEQKRANYEYYESRCIHESSLSPGVHSVLAVELGKMDPACEFFRYMARLDLDNYNRNSEQGLHVTAMSGAWLNVVYGFAGMRTDGEPLSFRPAIPEGWNRYRFRVVYRGAVIEVAVDRKAASFKAVAGPDATVRVYGDEVLVTSEGVSRDLAPPGCAD